MQSKKKLMITTEKCQITSVIAHHLWLTHSSSKNHHSQLRKVLSADCNHHSPLLLPHCLQNMAQILSLQCKGRILPKLWWDASVKRGKLREENYSNRISSYVPANVAWRGMAIVFSQVSKQFQVLVLILAFICQSLRLSDLICANAASRRFLRDC